MVVVPVELVGCNIAYFLERIEEIIIKHLGAVGLVKSLDTIVLRVFAWVDVIESDVLGLRPFVQCVSNELGAIVSCIDTGALRRYRASCKSS